MTDFLLTSTSFPTAILTVLLGVAGVYWILVITGLLELEAMEIDADLDIDGDTTATDGLAGQLASMGLGGIPLSLVLSLLILLAWLVCFFGARTLLPLLPGGPLQWLAGALLLVVSVILAIPVTVRLVRPLRGMFVVHLARRNDSLIGSPCEIRSLTVDERSGQALVEDGGAGMIVSVQASTPNRLTRGDRTIIIDYNQDDNIFRVRPDAINE